MQATSAWSLQRNGRSLVVPPTSSSHAAPLDGLRALAVLWVFTFHVLVVMPFFWGLDGEEREAYDAFVNSFLMGPVTLGDLGVDIFFILSGCLIMSILGKDMAPHISVDDGAQEKDREAAPLLGGNVQGDALTTLPDGADPNQGRPQRSRLVRVVASFFVRRYARLMPAYGVALLYVVIKWAATGAAADSCVPGIWSNLLFVNNFIGGCMPWSWSIAIEWQMYMVSPAVVWAALRYPRRARLILGILAAFSMALYMGLTLRTFYTDADFEATVYNMPYTRVFAYFFGMMVSVETTRRKQRNVALSDASAATTRDRMVTCALRVVAVAAVLLVVYDNGVSGSQAWRITKSVLARPVFVASMAYLVYDALRPQPDAYQRAVNWVLASRPLYIIAQLSYCIYLYHLFFAEQVYRILAEPLRNGDIVFVPQWMFPVMAVLMLICSVVASLVVYFVVEKPVNNLAAGFWRK